MIETMVDDEEFHIFIEVKWILRQQINFWLFVAGLPYILEWFIVYVSKHIVWTVHYIH